MSFHNNFCVIGQNLQWVWLTLVVIKGEAVDRVSNEPLYVVQSLLFSDNQTIINSKLLKFYESHCAARRTVCV